MLWVKSFHIVFVASWFAGLFYLPRIFVNLAMVPPESVAERARLLLMARKLMRFQLGRLAPPIWLDRILGTPEELDVAMKSAGDGWVVRAPRYGGGFRVDPLLAEATPWARFPAAEDATLYRFEAGRFVAPPAPVP